MVVSFPADQPRVSDVFNVQTEMEMPENFPADAHHRFMETARSVLLEPKGDAWKEFGGASNLIAWRFRACVEDLESFLASWRQSGSNVTFDAMYARERQLFGMFVSGLSCIESVCYAVYALASDPSVLAIRFGSDEQRKCSPITLRTSLEPHPKAEELVATLTDLLDSDEWKLWKNLRNRMTHRSNLPRIIQASGGSAPPPAQLIQFAETSSSPALRGDEAWVIAQGEWLARTVERLLVTGRALVGEQGEQDDEE